MGINKLNGLSEEIVHADVCVIGGGIAGMNAAINAARLGLNTVLIHERPVPGGNASGEIRMWICGNKDYRYKEAGLMEELNLENYYYNPNKRYPLWDALLYNKVTSCKNLNCFLNTTCFDAEVVNKKIVSITAYQMTTQKIIKVFAPNYIDCSGDSILAPLTGAEFMIGRENIDEFDEKMCKSHVKEDNATMGNSLLMQAVKRDKKINFIAPEWAEKVSVEKLKKLNFGFNSGENFWYIEIGGLLDTIKEAENINKRLLAICLGAWNTIKNSKEFDADYYDLDFIGMLGAKRESRRMLGEYVLNGNDIINNTKFFDEVAYGGWPMDDHIPDGFDGDTPNIYVGCSTYGIPFRCLYSKNISNLMFAGRNISMTHLAMSSARVMGTCGCLGAAVGVASYLLKKYNISPNQIIKDKHIKELQQLLLINDYLLPNISRDVNPINNLVKEYPLLRNGVDRNIESNNLTFITNDSEINYNLDGKIVDRIKIVFNSDFLRESFNVDEVEKHHNMRCFILEDSPTMSVPDTLAKDFELKIDNKLINFKNNLKRNILIDVNKKVNNISLKITSNWGNTEETGLFTFEII